VRGVQVYKSMAYIPDLTQQCQAFLHAPNTM
jgi:hypothetical protein